MCNSAKKRVIIGSITIHNKFTLSDMMFKVEIG